MRVSEVYFRYITLALFRYYEVPINPNMTLEENAELMFPDIRDRFCVKSASHRCGKVGCGRVLVSKSIKFYKV